MIYYKVGLLPLTNYEVKENIRDYLLESRKKERQPGFYAFLQTIENGMRSNTSKIFLGSVRNSENLTLILNAYAEKVLIDEVQKTDKGVKIRLAAESSNIYTNEEVILSAGALYTPQLLMLSGIGPTHRSWFRDDSGS
ncbi:hypothetical protein WA026_015214 [Henosepilachna vigintioctopunctata]|uniref:Glucose-methanol-choline oxidoreductase N-terminal domain-containing protein n=1 Tax=Henosepilachna vigintioctopunctata TaxID=420089 RepID=A0AAW1TMI6_9CUCU